MGACHPFNFNRFLLDETFVLTDGIGGRKHILQEAEATLVVKCGDFVFAVCIGNKRMESINCIDDFPVQLADVFVFGGSCCMVTKFLLIHFALPV